MTQKASILPDTFAVFILTHGRPDNVITYKTLRKCGYTGKLFFIIDDEDKSAERYVSNFGKDRVVIFDKKAVADTCDEGNNFDERRTILMARNACFGIAKELGVTHFLQLDDDYKQFKFRFENKLGYEAVVKDINRLFSAFLDFYKSTSVLSVALSQGGDHIGGFANTKLKRKCMNSFFCSTERPFQFVGAMNEDVNTYSTLGSRGELFFTFTSAQLDQKESQQQAGGITGMYLRFGTFCKAFTTVMMMPSSTKVSMMHSNNPRIHHAIDWKATVPCIVQERYCKARETRATSPAATYPVHTPIIELPAFKLPDPKPKAEEKKTAGLDTKWNDYWASRGFSKIEKGKVIS